MISFMYSVSQMGNAMYVYHDYVKLNFKYNISDNLLLKYLKSDLIRNMQLHAIVTLCM